ncbi:MAG: flagellar basal body rod protein FlgC [Armatimonadetes bacterium]|nr:flagellar basal body rod protein FlgC [Armatimonadota bacterium]
MSLFSGFEISGSALTAERLRMDIIANNIANVNTTRTAGGGPYKKQMPVFEAKPPAFADFIAQSRGQYQGVGQGVRVVGIVEDPAEPRRVFEPGHPDADRDGYVRYPNINIVAEMVDLISATRAYEANVTAINEGKAMMQRALDIGRV